MGSIRSPLWRHGGTVHGPQPRSYEYKLPRKMVLGALRSALSAKLRDGELRVVAGVQSGRSQDEEHSAQSCTKLEAKKTVLLVEAGENMNLTLRLAQSRRREAGADPRRERI